MRRSAQLFVLLLAARMIAQESKPAKSEIEVLYDEDQQDRKGGIKLETITAESVARLIEHDAAHATRVRALLTTGALKSGTDFEKAAFIFQHGRQPADQLFAHILAMVAMSKGDKGASWIAAATLDRYLQGIGQPQVWGTQYQRFASKPSTQEPFDRNLVPDSLREELGVPPLEQQAKRLAEMNQAQQPSPK
jgi:hypothetical protein